MASNITLSAGVRQNLLSLQNTAALASLTQGRLATGKKVNSALDNPTNFFTSQSLSDRANDLNSLLDSIGQAQKTLEAADKGLSSLSKLVESAKSIARQARQATQQSATYGAVNANSDISAALNLNGDEVIGTLTGNNTSLTSANFDPIAIAKTFTTDGNDTVATRVATGAVPGTSAGGTLSFDITIDGTTTTITTATIGPNETAVNIRDAINTAINANGATNGRVVASEASGILTLTASDSDVDFTINANALSFEYLLTTSAVANFTATSTSLYDRLVAAGGAAGDTLSISINGGATQTLVFGTGAGQVSTVADVNTALNALTGGVSASLVTDQLSFSLAAGANNSIALSTSSTALRNALGLDGARTAGQGGAFGNGVTNLSRTYNSAATLSDADPTNLLNGGNLTVTVNGSAQTVGLAANDRLADIITKLQANATLNNALTFDTSSGDLRITAKTADVDFTITHNNVAAAIGLTSGTNVTTNSTSLFDRLSAGGVLGSAAQGSTLTIAANGGAVQTFVFGTGANEISTKDELSAALATLSGATGTLSGTSLNLQVASSSAATSLTIGGSAASKLGLTVGTTDGVKTLGAESSVRANLQSDYNSVLTQIDALAKDSSYNGVNLLFGDNLKVVFNEKGTSSLTITGVKVDTNGLGLTSASGSAFQDDSKIDGTITQLDSALTTLRTQASKFGSSLTTVQVRQDFTKDLITTLQTGADNLVLADTNEEGANLLALQTRQQLSTTALSLSAQAAQAVLRLF